MEFQWRNWAANAEGITGDELQQFIDQRLFPALRDLPAHDPRSFMVREVFEGNNNYMKSGTNLRSSCLSLPKATPKYRGRLCDVMSAAIV